MTGVVAISMFVTHYVIPGTVGTESNRIMAFSIWTFFVLLNGYYGGAMTMFFTSTITMDLETRRDVIQAYPDWKLIFKDGAQIDFIIYVNKGDQDYVEYWARDQADQTETRFGTTEEGLHRIASSQEIMFIEEPVLKGWLRANPFHSQVRLIQNGPLTNNLSTQLYFQKLDVFGKGKPTYAGLIYGLNSPLQPIFRKAAFAFRYRTYMTSPNV